MYDGGGGGGGTMMLVAGVILGTVVYMIKEVYCFIHCANISSI